MLILALGLGILADIGTENVMMNKNILKDWH